MSDQGPPQASTLATRSREERTRRATHILALLAFCGFFFFAGIQLLGLLGPDEPRYAQVAREMLQRHDWVTPYLYGQPWLEKPPLYYWSAMVMYKVTGEVSDWAARLPSAIFSSLLIFFIYLWARRFRRGMELDAAVITAASAMVLAFGRSASTDSLLMVFSTLAMLSWFSWHASRNRGWLLGFYSFLALATLAKGPVALLLAFLIILVFAVLRRSGQIFLRTLWPIGIVLYLILALPWFIAVQHANPEFFRVFILQHSVGRYTGGFESHPQPFWFYVPIALLAVLPWTVFVVNAMVDAIRDWRFSVEQPPGEEDLRTYLTVWTLVVVVFFSLSRSKLPGYILPAVPAGSILLANFILRREQEGDKPAFWLILLHALLSAAILVGALVLPFRLLKVSMGRGAIAIAVTLAIVAVLSLWASLMTQGYRMLRFTTLIPVIIAFALLLKGTVPMINVLQSARPVEQVLEQTAVGQIPDIAVYDAPRGLRYGLAFYRNHPVLSYEAHEIPAGDHIVVAAAGSKAELEYMLPGRRVIRFGGFSPQNLDFYAITAIPSQSKHP